MNLHLDWCSYEAAKYAVMNWHYSKTMPVCKLVKIGVWEDSCFVGALIFGMSNNTKTGEQFGVTNFEACELLRVALGKHKTETTRVVSIALKMLHKAQSKLKCVVSYADTNVGHSGIIYRAGNWDYLGQIKSSDTLLLNGKEIHNRSLCASNSTVIRDENPIRHILPNKKKLPKHKFVYWFDKSAREVFMQKRLLSSKRGGTIPTHALHSK